MVKRNKLVVLSLAFCSRASRPYKWQEPLSAFFTTVHFLNKLGLPKTNIYSFLWFQDKRRSPKRRSKQTQEC